MSISSTGLSAKSRNSEPTALQMSASSRKGSCAHSRWMNSAAPRPVMSIQMSSGTLPQTTSCLFCARSTSHVLVMDDMK